MPISPAPLLAHCELSSEGIHFAMKIGVIRGDQSDSHTFWIMQVWIPFILHRQKDSLAKSNIFLTPSVQGLTASLWLHSDSKSIPVIYLEDKCHDTAPPLLSYLHSFCRWTQTERMSCPWGQFRTAVPAVPSQLLGLTPWLCYCTAQQKLKPSCVPNAVSPRGPKHSPTRAARTKVNSSPQSLVLYSVWRITQIKGMFWLCFILYPNSDFSHFNVRPAYKCLLSFPVL